MSRSSFRGGSVYRCRFGGSEVDATYASDHDELRCITPAGAEGTAVVQVSLNGVQFTTAYAESPQCVPSRSSMMMV